MTPVPIRNDYDSDVTHFMNGEEVMYQGRRYVITHQSGGPNGVRLLAAGGRYGEQLDIVYADESELERIGAYRTALRDTDAATDH